MIDRENFLNLNILKKEDYTGSMDGMRYRLNKVEGEEGEVKLRVTVWPEPFCFDKTPEDKKTVKEFGFGEEGKMEAADWLNAQWKEMKK
ncbi:hypothetical protein D7X88_00075 [bacterium C-53]|nr:hypothetical protein [Lachnospiraceae bacterium]NBI01416.1 hypothetical protein [Lachnospiraceae bacterium]RKJ12729.1 hypothetical protein D7X88_00075 [bacterium C-53]